MNMKIDDGGSAFPIKGYTADASGALNGEHVIAAGMSLRDYFATFAPLPSYEDARAMMGWPSDIPTQISWAKLDQKTDSVEARLNALSLAERIDLSARWSYYWADAMLAARKETQ